MSQPLRVIFAGTPEFAAEALAQILAAGHTVPLVLTQPDRPAGRGLKLQASAVKQLAEQHHIPVAQPLSLRLDGKYPDDAKAAQAAIAEAIAKHQADVMVVAAYGLILPQWTLDAPPLGCLNIHASLLPRWRGAAPIHRAIEAGDAKTGVVIMQMDAGLDTGDMLLTDVLDIAADENTASLHDRLASMGGALVVRALADAKAVKLHPVKQAEVGMTYARKIEKAEAAVDWQQPAEAIGRRVRAFNPFPGASAQLGADVIKLWRATVENTAHSQAAGTVISADPHGVRVACGEGVLCVTELQRAGGKRLNAADFLRGFALRASQCFEPPPPSKSGLKKHMFWQRKLYQHPEFNLGARDLAPQAFGQIAWALMTGVALVKSGMSVFESVFMTLLVYAGSSQLAATPLIVAGAPAWVVLAAGFCVNLRFVVFSLHMRGYLMHLPRLPRIVAGYFTTDPVYVLFTRRFPHPALTDEHRLTQEAYLAGLSFANWGSWMSCSLLGIALANAIPTSWGLGFAGILCLLGIQCSLASSRLRVLSAIVAGMVAVLAYALPLKLNIVVAILLAVFACLMAEQLKAVKERPV